MKNPIEIGFDGTFEIFCKHVARPLTIKLARSTKEPDSFECSKNYNFQLKNTFLWHEKENPELLYRDRDGKLYKVNFEPA